MNNEEKLTKRLNSVYTQSQKDINQKIKDLSFKIGELQVKYDWMDDADPEKAKVKSMIQSKIYQKQYQEQLKKQVDGILDQLKVKQYTNISDYLDECYTDGFIGTIFDLHGQGVPLMMPIDQQAMVRAVQLDSKISKGLYTHLGENVDMLKKHITAQVSRGISTGMTYAQVAKQISGKVMGTYENPGGSMAYSMRIARTEGHRIQCASAMDALESAKEKGADVVKQWDAALDARTRESHQAVDGEIREVDKPFSNGLMYPGDPSGGAAEVVNCRCALLQRAKWALDDDELETLKQRAEHFGLDKTDSFEDFKKKYLKSAGVFQDTSKDGVDYSARRKARLAQRTQAQQQAIEPHVESLDELQNRVATKHNINIDTSEIGNLTDEAKRQIEAIDGLLDEYDSTLVDFRFVKGKVLDGEGGSCYMLNGKSSIAVKTRSIKKNVPDNLNLGENNDLLTTYHEFAHALSQSREGVDEDFWKDLKKVRTKYRKALKDIDKAEVVDHSIGLIEAVDARKRIFISNYADSDIDEFLAEAFAQAKLSTTPSPFAKEVLEIVDKHFKKPLTNSSNSVIVQMGNVEVRKWYVDKVSKIADGIDKSLSVEEKARLAFEARNAIRTEARNMMADQATRKLLDREHPNKTFEELVESKMKRKGMTREEAVQDVFETATKTNADINKELGLGDD